MLIAEQGARVLIGWPRRKPVRPASRGRIAHDSSMNSDFESDASPGLKRKKGQAGDVLPALERTTGRPKMKLNDRGAARLK